MVTVTINGTTYKPGDTVVLPVGTTPIVYTITDANGNNYTSPTSATVAGPPTITAPPPTTVNATSPSGAPVILQPPAGQYCGVPTCNVTILYNGTVYKPGDVVPIPVGNNSLTYIIVDALLKTATSPTSVTVNPLPPGYE